MLTELLRGASLTSSLDLARSHFRASLRHTQSFLYVFGFGLGKFQAYLVDCESQGWYASSLVFLYQAWQDSYEITACYHVCFPGTDVDSLRMKATLDAELCE